MTCRPDYAIHWKLIFSVYFPIERKNLWTTEVVVAVKDSFDEGVDTAGFMIVRES